MLFQCLQNPFEHEINENARIGLGGAVIDGLVIAILVVMHHGLHGEMQEHGVQFCKDEGLPEAPRPSVAIGEGVDELQLVMEHATPNQKVVFGSAKPVKETGDELGNLPGGWCDMYDLFPRKDTDTASAEISRTVHQGRPSSCRALSEGLPRRRG